MVADVLADLHLLTVIAQTRNLTQAARRLRISKASVSTRLKDLERVVGMSLVRRTTRSVTLTAAALQLVDDTQASFARIEQSLSQAKDLAGKPRGLVRITAPVALGRQRIAPSVPDFLRRFPEIRLELDLSDRFVNLAQEGFDLAVRHARSIPDTYIARVLCESRSLLLASPEYLQRRGTPEHPTDLARHDCLLYLRDGAAQSWSFEKVGARKSRGSRELGGTRQPGGARETGGSRELGGPRERGGSRETGRAREIGGSRERGGSRESGGTRELGGSRESGGARELRGSRAYRPGEHVSVPVGGPFKANNSEVLREAIVGGLGIGLLPDFSADAAGMVPVLADWRPVGFFGERIYAVRAGGVRGARAVECAIEHLRQVFG